MPSPAFRFENVSKRFGPIEALKGFSLEVPRQGVTGFIGRSGSGKSTAIRCLMGLQRPDQGTVELLGRDPWDMDVETKQSLGYLSERGVPFPWASAEDLVAFCAPRYPRWDAALEQELLGRFRIARTRPLKTLSLGQQRAVGLLLALCPRPEVLVLDEPAANLDPVLRREFLDQITGLVAGGPRAVFFSTHILGDVARVCDRIAVIHEGRTVLDCPASEIREGLEARFLALVGGAGGKGGA